MKPNHTKRTLTSLVGLVLLATAGFAVKLPLKYPKTPMIPVHDTIHGVELVDNYRWLEKSDDPQVLAWTDSQEKVTRGILDHLPQRPLLVKRFNQLWRYDDEGIPEKVIRGSRTFYYVKKKDAEKIIYYVRENDSAPGKVVLDPNQWPADEDLSGFSVSFDGKYAAFGKDKGGNENPVIRVMEVATRAILPDTVRGRRQYPSSWLPDNSGFFYTANPVKGSVPAGEEEYWDAVWFHRLGTPADRDRRVFGHDSVKEYNHAAWITEDGKYLILSRSTMAKNDVYFRPLSVEGPLIPIATGFEGQYNVDIIKDTIIITTDSGAPMQKVYFTTVDKPGKENWRELIPENKQDHLSYVSATAGRLYANYEHDAHTVIRIYSLGGRFIREMRFPTLGSAYAGGLWSDPNVWVLFTSFTYPRVLYRYDYDRDSLIVYRKFPLDINVSNYTSEQVWYKSRDSTPISMFLVHRKDIRKNGGNPVLLTGYGGFEISLTPYFSTSYVTWLEAGGMVAIPNLRGGGEYGKAWHEAGMLAYKQNVFDDFAAAAEWLIANKYTTPAKLAIEGASNGGLLVGAVAIERPELFRAVGCDVPLLDMIRYHKFGYANIWRTEYGTADDSSQFRYLLRYSPYQNVRDGARYPAMLLTGSENDARVWPLHVRKMAARLQAADPGGGPFLLLVQKSSGHGGGTTLSTQIEQAADRWAFLMSELNMTLPARPK